MSCGPSSNGTFPVFPFQQRITAFSTPQNTMPPKFAAYNVFLAFYPPLPPQDVRQSDFAILLMPKENGSDKSIGPVYRYFMSKSPSGKLQYERQILPNSELGNACRVLLGKLADSCGGVEQATRRLDQVMSVVLSWPWEEAGRTSPPPWLTAVLDVSSCPWSCVIDPKYRLYRRSSVNRISSPIW